MSFVPPIIRTPYSDYSYRLFRLSVPLIPIIRTYSYPPCRGYAYPLLRSFVAPHCLPWRMPRLWQRCVLPCRALHRVALRALAVRCQRTLHAGALHAQVREDGSPVQYNPLGYSPPRRSVASP